MRFSRCASCVHMASIVSEDTGDTVGSVDSALMRSSISVILVALAVERATSDARRSTRLVRSVIIIGSMASVGCSCAWFSSACSLRVRWGISSTLCETGGRIGSASASEAVSVSVDEWRSAAVI
ncbi:hypothetical protein METBIDRAFT_195048 [Metschnikowia bicuspidata var. bicuspidata NRRL YB-4993]|uniref:Uncharacterized protein n=1 Tax=Metschnikowia bicuspidata var. bicuspidata NRRL YB-4993 TaxID=869754 RepID=A0A1A0H8R2_9ASCO|nr:hypothetical protein METBIDRAFT_195048 [Metschnikowia bicuspidata var. bicuspidata NRRL YB-4993]OBA20273.1 hypothetical protein METBIDRAFT_195048 [Metschnikowia bicuspidata var. bicuspidata NRRL YB-4993]